MELSLPGAKVRGNESSVILSRATSEKRVADLRMSQRVTLKFAVID